MQSISRRNFLGKAAAIQRYQLFRAMCWEAKASRHQVTRFMWRESAQEAKAKVTSPILRKVQMLKLRSSAM